MRASNAGVGNYTFIWKIVQDRATVTMECQHVFDLCRAL